jgi:thiol-disulfide isomerase/thioredoxin
VATVGYSIEWFMPGSFFEKLGYVVHERRGGEALYVKSLGDAGGQWTARLPAPRYSFRPVEGRVAVDLFWNTFCQTSRIEAARVREVAAEFGDKVVLREYCADDADVLRAHELPRAIFVNGKEVGWGCEAPREGLRKVLSEAVSRLS